MVWPSVAYGKFFLGKFLTRASHLNIPPRRLRDRIGLKGFWNRRLDGEFVFRLSQVLASVGKPLG
jgi:hypothetical protein